MIRHFSFYELIRKSEVTMLRVLSRCLLFVGAVLVASVALARTCGDVFAEAQRSLDTDFSFHLRQVSQAPGRFGGETFILQRNTYVKRRLFMRPKEVKLDWWHFNTNPDKLGDIRWAATYLPDHLKEIFTVDALSKDLRPVDPWWDEVEFVRVPDAKEVRNVLARLNEYGRRRGLENTVINFYGTQEIESSRIYLTKFAKNLELPLATRGHLYEHDFNYHVLSSLVMDPALVRALQKRAELALLFDKFVSEKARAQEELRAVSAHVENSVLQRVVESIDLSGNIFMDLFRHSKVEKRNKDVQSSMNSIFYGTFSPKEFLDRIVKEDLPKKNSAEIQDVYQEFTRRIGMEYVRADLPHDWFENPKLGADAAITHLGRLNRMARDILELDGQTLPQ